MYPNASGELKIIGVDRCPSVVAGKSVGQFERRGCHGNGLAFSIGRKTWMAGPCPAMTIRRASAAQKHLCAHDRIAVGAADRHVP